MIYRNNILITVKFFTFISKKDKIKKSIEKDCYSLNIRREKMTCKTHEHHDHVHGANCGHEAVPHGDHVDYIVNGRLHHQHGDHCDDHGPVEIVK